MWEERAHRTRREIAALAGSGLGVSELHAAAIALVGRHVGADLTCWAAIDPETLVISTMTNGPALSPPEYDPVLARSEYAPDQPHSFATLARRGSTVAKLTDMSSTDRRRSLRLQDVWRPLGMNQELRLMFRTDGTCWGAAGMARAGTDFSDRETDYLRAVAPAVATATRLAVRAEATGSEPGVAPAVVLVGPEGRLRATTAAAEEWQSRFEEIAPGRFAVMMQVMASGARAAASDGFSARIRDARGQWVALRASPLTGAETDDVAVVIEAVGGDQLARLLLIAYGLSAREREVCHQVIAGHSTAEIAAQLFISPNTVQDHLKSIFAKVAVRSRGELVARIRPSG